MLSSAWCLCCLTKGFWLVELPVFISGFNPSGTSHHSIINYFHVQDWASLHSHTRYRGQLKLSAEWVVIAKDRFSTSSLFCFRAFSIQLGWFVCKFGWLDRNSQRPKDLFCSLSLPIQVKGLSFWKRLASLWILVTLPLRMVLATILANRPSRCPLASMRIGCNANKI